MNKFKFMFISMLIFISIIMFSPEVFAIGNGGGGNGNSQGNNNTSQVYGTYLFDEENLRQEWDFTNNNIKNKNNKNSYDRFNNKNIFGFGYSYRLNGIVIERAPDKYNYNIEMRVYRNFIEVTNAFIFIPVASEETKEVFGDFVSLGNIFAYSTVTDDTVEISLYNFETDGYDDDTIYEATDGLSISYSEKNTYEYDGITYVAFWAWHFYLTKIEVDYYSCDVALYQQETRYGYYVRWIGVIDNVKVDLEQIDLSIHCYGYVNKFLSFFRDEKKVVKPSKIYESIKNPDGSYYSTNIDGEVIEFSPKEGRYYVIYVLKLKEEEHKEYIGCYLSAELIVDGRNSGETESYRITRLQSEEESTNDFE